MQEASVSGVTGCGESSSRLPTLKVFLLHETARGHRGTGDRAQKRADPQPVYAAVIPEAARGLLESSTALDSRTALDHVRLKKAGFLSVLHVAQLKHRGESLGCILEFSRTGVKKTENIRGVGGGGEEIPPLTLRPAGARTHGSAPRPPESLSRRAPDPRSSGAAR